MSQSLTTSAFWILTVLASGRRHGYDILSETRTASDGRVSLKVATLYAALERLESEGSIRVDGDEIVNGRARRYYVLTDDGACATGSGSAGDGAGGEGCAAPPRDPPRNPLDRRGDPMTGREDAFERLLRWYPKAWREAHGAVFLDTLREQSEHEGRNRPSRGETFAAVGQRPRYTPGCASSQAGRRWPGSSSEEPYRPSR